ncbi:hypothetical protein K438DRAFT_1817723 [Mycena galopus ATCC 62051]|nr:hypothetical protein K438DRAFT_1817723 [Mycena galopus ATCC 62051]
MDDPTPESFQFTSESTINDGASAPYAGAFFPGSQNLVVNGGTFTSHVTGHELYTDFRRIPLGDINLLREIRVNACVAFRGRARVSARRVHSARIGDGGSLKTVILYEGDHAEDDWRWGLAKHSAVRHPNIVQIYAAASSSGIHAAIFHEDLTPFYDFLAVHHHSHFLTVFIYWCYDADYSNVDRYFLDKFGDFLGESNSTFWIRRGTGRLSLELTPGNIFMPLVLRDQEMQPPPDAMPFHHHDPDTSVMKFLTLDNYHRICYDYLHQHHYHHPPPPTKLHVGVVYSPAGTPIADSVPVAYLLPVELRNYDSICSAGEVMENGWTRISSRSAFGRHVSKNVIVNDDWLPQANHIFHRLGMPSNVENYRLNYYLHFNLHISTPARRLPEGYLFLCPVEDFQCGPATFRWPDDLGYWSTDPSGLDRLSRNEAIALGFPSVTRSTLIYQRSWDASFYAGVRQLHEAKGFDPYSQDVAKLFGHPLLQLCTETDAGLTHHYDRASSEASAATNGLNYAEEDEEEASTDTESNYENHYANPAVAESTNSPTASEAEFAELICAEHERRDSELAKTISETNVLGVEPSPPHSKLSQITELIKLALIIFLGSVALYDFFTEG